MVTDRPTPVGFEILSFCARATARRLLVPWLLATAATAVALLALGRLEGAGPDAAAGLWLHLPCFLLSIAGIAAALETWPMLCRGRRGAGLLERLQPPGVDGCVAAVAGALMALATALIAAAVAFTGLLAARGDLPVEPREHVTFAISGRPILDLEQQRLELTGPAEARVSQLKISPLVVWEHGRLDRALDLLVTAGGQPLHRAPLEVTTSHEELVLRFPAQPLPRLELAVTAESGLSLYFPPDAVEGVLDVPHSALLNALLAAGSYLLPCAFALALTTLARRQIGVPVSLATGMACLLAFTLFDWMPNSRAIADFAARRWLLSGDFLARSALSVGIVGVVMVAAVFTRGRRTP